MIRLPQLSPGNLAFPPIESALEEPNGLLAFGGDLGVARLIEAYTHGIFPWYSDGQPILWWSPDPRMVFATASPHIPRRLSRWLRSCSWTISVDTAFDDVMRQCAAPRRDGEGTWITEAMYQAYRSLHREGHAHSLEVRDDGRLIGGIYGVAVGRMFFGESMFSLADNASKLALLALCKGLSRKGFPLLDAQVSSGHLETLGGIEMPRDEFSLKIAGLVTQSSHVGNWGEWFGEMPIRALCRGGLACSD